MTPTRLNHKAEFPHNGCPGCPLFITLYFFPSSVITCEQIWLLLQLGDTPVAAEAGNRPFFDVITSRVERHARQRRQECFGLDASGSIMDRLFTALLGSASVYSGIRGTRKLLMAPYTSRLGDIQRSLSHATSESKGLCSAGGSVPAVPFN